MPGAKFVDQNTSNHRQKNNIKFLYSISLPMKNENTVISHLSSRIAQIPFESNYKYRDMNFYDSRKIRERPFCKNPSKFF